jgi:beta-glucosidase
LNRGSSLKAIPQCDPGGILTHEQVLYAAGTKILTNDDTGFAEAVAAAKRADIVLTAVGEDPLWMTGEAASRAHLGLPGNQQQLLEAVAATGKPIVLIVFSGRPLVLDWAANHVPAVLQAWFPGVPPWCEYCLAMSIRASS